MRFLPNSLLTRTALVIIVVLTASQIVSVLLFRYYSEQPRIQLTAVTFLSHLRTIRAALEVATPEQRPELLAKFREQRSIRIITPDRIAEEPIELAADTATVHFVRERLKEQFGPDADIYVFKGQINPPPNKEGTATAADINEGNKRNGRPDNRNGGKPAEATPNQLTLVVTKLPVGDTHYWVVYPRNRVFEQDFSLAWLGWGIFGGILALGAAVFLVNRLNRPLKELANAAEAIGRGEYPPPLTQQMPSEVTGVATAFNHMSESLARQERDRATFLAGVSHDLRTPLSRLRLGVEMLPTDPATRADIENDIADINGVIDQFLDFARDESSEALELVDLDFLLRGMAERATRAGARIKLELAKLDSIRVRPLAIQRLIGNLIDNAVKHAGSEIAIHTQKSAEGISFSVMDRGPGIPASEVERLKQPFSRMDDARSGISGAGLGLAIVERISRMHGGQFEIRQRDGGGCEARVTLPMA